MHAFSGSRPKTAQSAPEKKDRRPKLSMPASTQPAQHPKTEHNAYRAPTSRPGITGPSHSARLSATHLSPSPASSWTLRTRALGRRQLIALSHQFSTEGLKSCTWAGESWLGVSNLLASNGYLQQSVWRHGFLQVALHGSCASASAAEEAAWMAQIQQQPACVDPDFISIVDKTGVQYRGLPSRS